MIRFQHIQKCLCVMRHGLRSACNDDQLLWRHTPLQQTQHAASPPVHSMRLTEEVPRSQAEAHRLDRRSEAHRLDSQLETLHGLHLLAPVTFANCDGQP